MTSVSNVSCAMTVNAPKHIKKKNAHQADRLLKK